MRQFSQYIGDDEYSRLQRLLTRKGEQLAHQISRAVAILLDLHNVGERLVLRTGTLQQKIAEPNHGSQQIIEIMRDASG